MVDDLLCGRVTSFRREQGFGVITLDDGRDVKFDASNCTMIPEEGAAVRLRVGPAKWGGGVKALHVEPHSRSSTIGWQYYLVEQIGHAEPDEPRDSMRSLGASTASQATESSSDDRIV